MSRIDLFPEAPRRPRIVRMHVVDAGLPGDAIQFRCDRCGYDTGWIKFDMSVLDAQRGLPCPHCNAPAPGARQAA